LTTDSSSALLMRVLLVLVLVLLVLLCTVPLVPCVARFCLSDSLGMTLFAAFCRHRQWWKSYSQLLLRYHVLFPQREPIGPMGFSFIHLSILSLADRTLSLSHIKKRIFSPSLLLPRQHHQQGSLYQPQRSNLIHFRLHTAASTTLSSGVLY
jgi:hypothetical protein